MTGDVSAARETEALRLLTYNVKHLALDRDGVVTVLGDADADVVAVQEPPRGIFRYRLHQVARAAGLRVALRGRGARTTAFLVRADLAASGSLRARSLPDSFPSAQASDRVLPGATAPTGPSAPVGPNALAAAPRPSRPPDVVRTRRVRLPFRGPRSRRARPILRGVAILELHGLTIVNVHLSLDTAERARHVEIVRRLVDSGPFDDGAGPGRVVLVGDLNETPTDVSWRTLRTVLDDAFDRARSGAGDPRPGQASGRGSEPVGTVKDVSPERTGDLDPVDAGAQPLTFPAHEPRLRLDGILVGHEVEVHEVAVVDTRAARRASDHLPVLAVLATRSAPWRTP